MAKVRVYELAKQLGLSPAGLKATLDELGVPIKSVSSTLDESISSTVVELLARGKPASTAVLDRQVSVRELAKVLKTDTPKLLGAMLSMGMPATVNQQLAPETAAKVAAKLGVTLEAGPAAEPAAEPVAPAAEPAAKKAAQARPPVVTIMGHVDHGKTTLLDAIRHTNVTEQEFGGITQHIGAYQVEVDGRKITFIDTPGHEAFTAMRARGAQITDVAVLVIGADDGVMPQTIEAISHARAAKVPIIVAINKIDRPEANPDRVKQQLMDHQLTPEEWGGDTIMVPVSAKQATGIDHLLEMVLLVAELAELTSDPNAPAQGTIVEAALDRRQGPLATVLVQQGTLRVGDPVVAGLVSGKIRSMTDDRGRPLREATPSTPVEISGLSGVPQAGDRLEVVVGDRTSKQIAAQRQQDERTGRLRATGGRLTLAQLFQQVQAGEVRALNIVLKTDVEGSIDALRKSIEQLRHPEVNVSLLHTGVGDISESDVLLASASKAIVIGFNVRIEPQARKAAEDEHVEVRVYRVIYDVIDDLRAAITGMLRPVYEEVVLGRAEVRAVFRISRTGTVAGCSVTEGVLRRGADIRVYRGGKEIHRGRLDSLRHLKEDVREMAQGFECGVMTEGFSDWQQGDLIEAFTIQEKRRETV